MHNLNILAVLMLFTVILLSCSEDTPLEPAPPANKLSTFGKIQSQVFDAGCNTSGCHAGSNPAAGLDLTAGNSYNQLVEVNSVLVPARKRVDTNSSSESVLINILEGTVAPRMPLGGNPLSAATIDSIAKWIDEGALNN